MDLFIYLQIASIEKIRFSHPIQEWVKSLFPKTILFDADNHSDEIVISYGLEQFEPAQCITVFIEAVPDEKLGGMMRLIQKLVRVKGKQVTIFFNGEHAMVEKMIGHCSGSLIRNQSNTNIQEQIKLHSQSPS